jgi:hypothetical protein
LAETFIKLRGPAREKGGEGVARDTGGNS